MNHCSTWGIPKKKKKNDLKEEQGGSASRRGRWTQSAQPFTTQITWARGEGLRRVFRPTLIPTPPHCMARDHHTPRRWPAKKGWGAWCGYLRSSGAATKSPSWQGFTVMPLFSNSHVIKVGAEMCPSWNARSKVPPFHLKNFIKMFVKASQVKSTFMTSSLGGVRILCN